MEQRDIEILLTLADELHFGRAAQRLHVSTARVSQTIKKLERRIGAPLFERTSRRVEPTPLGSRLCDELRPAYQRIQDAIGRAMSTARDVHLLVEEDQMLAVSDNHPFARRPSVSFADVARTTVLRTPPTISAHWDKALVPPHTPEGRPVERGHRSTQPRRCSPSSAPTRAPIRCRPSS